MMMMTKVNQFFQLVWPIITSSFNEIGSLLLQQSCSQPDRQNDSDRMIDTDHITSLAEVTILLSARVALLDNQIRCRVSD